MRSMLQRPLLPLATLFWGLQFAFLSPSLALILVSLYGEYQMGLLVDSSKVQLGMLLNVVMPAFNKRLATAMGG